MVVYFLARANNARFRSGTHLSPFIIYISVIIFKFILFISFDNFSRRIRVRSSCCRSPCPDSHLKADIVKGNSKLDLIRIFIKSGLNNQNLKKLLSFSEFSTLELSDTWPTVTKIVRKNNVTLIFLNRLFKILYLYSV